MNTTPSSLSGLSDDGHPSTGAHAAPPSSNGANDAPCPSHGTNGATPTCNDASPPSTDAEDTPTDDAYRLILPHPGTIRDIAEGSPDKISDPKISEAIRLAKEVSALRSDKEVQQICESIMALLNSQRPKEGETAPIGDSARWFGYDLYFQVQRLPEPGSRKRALEILALAWAITMRDMVHAKCASKKMTAYQYRLLCQAFVTVLEIVENELTPT